MASPLIPRSVLFGNPQRIAPEVSPDGHRLAFLAPDDGVLNVWVGDIGGGEFRPVTHDRDRGVQTFAWAHDNEHLLYVQDQGGDENFRLYGVELSTGRTHDLTAFDGVQVQVIGTSKRHPDVVLVGINKENPQLHDVYRVQLSTRSLEQIENNPGFVRWLVDDDLQVRGGMAPQPDGGIALVTRDADGQWRPLVVFGPDDALNSGAVGFTTDGSSLILLSSIGVNAGRLVRRDLASGEETVIAEDPTYDVAGALLHPDTREVQAVLFLKDRMDFVVLDESIADDFAALRKLHPGDLVFHGRDHADRIWLVGYTADDGPVPYYVWHRDTQEATYLFTHRPELEDFTLAKVEPFSFTARDGLEIHGYLTFPPDAERRGLPAVLNVHGGPWTRDTWGFDPEAQWLANRGYLSVQVNYRGSTGYGKAFLNAGDKEWGAKMHDDLIDAVDWVVEQGYADPDRVGIYGGSYGGFAALTGATVTPDVFRCAVDIVGPSNLTTWIEGVPPYWAPMLAMLHRRVGNPETEGDLLWERSPLSKVDKIRIPLLIAQGANDPRVKQVESEQIVAALRDKGIDHEYLLFDDEGHGFVKPENRLTYYAAAERFLATHLGGRCEE